MKKKKFDCVEFQRKVRAQLSKKYAGELERELRELREKFEHPRKEQKAQE